MHVLSVGLKLNLYKQTFSCVKTQPFIFYLFDELPCLGIGTLNWKQPRFYTYKFL